MKAAIKIISRRTAPTKRPVVVAEAAVGGADVFIDLVDVEVGKIVGDETLVSSCKFDAVVDCNEFDENNDVVAEEPVVLAVEVTF